MHGLPEQSISDALYDLKQAIEIAPPHLSWYRLTIEPNTAFCISIRRVPWKMKRRDIQEQGHQLLLLDAGYRQYGSRHANPVSNVGTI